MCSYILDGSHEAVPADKLIQQFDEAAKSLDSETGPLSVKVYTSGSFLDPEEVPTPARDEILRVIGGDDRVSEVVLESRPQFVTDDQMANIRSMLGECQVEIGIGLESSNDAIRTLCVNKGFETKDFESAVKIAGSHGIGVRAYVLLKPPFLTERDALLDAKGTIEDAAKMEVTTISVNPVNVQKHTLVERMWSRGLYRPPWLWSLIDVLHSSRNEIDRSINIVCDPVGAGKPRGTHNCGSCDEVITNAIRSFSLDQKEAAIEGLKCGCKQLWRHTLEHEDFTLLVHRYRVPKDR